jgi:hypothetical protein
MQTNVIKNAHPQSGLGLMNATAFSPLNNV